MSALANEPTTLGSLPPCDDIDAMIASLRQLGTEFRGDLDGGLTVIPDLNRQSDIELDARQSGTSLRLLLAVAALRTGNTHFTGHSSLAARPNDGLLLAIANAGCRIESNQGKLPITVQGPISQSKIQVDASLSSQYVSALMLIAPTLESGCDISIAPGGTSLSYIDITLNEMSKRGIEHEKFVDSTTNEVIYRIPNQTFNSGKLTIEGDASASTYHMALATLHGGQVCLTNLNSSTLQGDFQFSSICNRLGSETKVGSSGTEISGPSRFNQLREKTVDMSDMPDAAPTLMALAPYLPQPITITGLHSLPLKECDRIECPATELRRAGIKVETTKESIRIWPGKPKPTVFNTYDDHRMAMAFSVLATKTEGCRIEDPKCVNKTYTQFWEHLALAYG